MPKAFLPCWSSCQFEQERQYGSGQQPPVAVQHVAHEGPILRFLQTNRPVNFCYTKEEVVRQYKTIPESSGKSIKPPPEYAARLQGPRTSGIVRTRVNKTGHAPTAIISTVADRLGLQRRPLRGPGAVFSILYNGLPTPLEVLNEPLTVQLLAGPNNVVLEVTLPAVVVVPDLSGWNNTLFELQLGLFDFCAAVEMDWLPMWASQFRDIASGYCCAVPVIAPPPPHAYSHIRGSSTFHIAQESYEEVLELAIARQAVQARRAAAAAVAAGDEGGPSPAEAAAEAVQQARRVGAALSTTAATAATPAVGTQEWVDEWAPAPRQQQQQRGRGGRQGRGRSRGRGRGRGGSRQHASAAADAADITAAAEAHVLVQAAEAGAVNAAQAVTDIYAELDPLPPSLTACTWQQAAAASLPQGDDDCTICFESMAGDSTGLVVHLSCRHTYCVLCLRQVSTFRNFKRRPLECPQCRQEVSLNVNHVFKFTCNCQLC